MEALLAAITGTRSRFSSRAQALTTWLHWAMIALLATLPFELNGGFRLAGLTLTNVELLALVASGLWAALLVSERRWPQVPRWLVFGTTALLAALIVSALLAGPWRGAALKFTARQIQGALIGVCLADQMRRHGWPLARQFAIALIAGATVSAILGLLEMAEWSPVLWLLMAFKDQPTLAGGLLRLSATFGYANIAAMYFEAILPLALLGVGQGKRQKVKGKTNTAAEGKGQKVKGKRDIAAVRSFLPFTFYLLPFTFYVAALLTYSRAALLTATVVVIGTMVGSVALQRRAAGRTEMRSAPVVALGSGLLAFLVALLLLSPSFQIRIAEPDVDRWYRATYQASTLPTLPPNGIAQVPVTVANDGRVTWRSTSIRPVSLSYHWLDARTRLVVRYNGRRTALPEPLDPGQSVTLDALVQAPNQPGDYLLVWDMVVEQSGWFSERGNPVVERPVQVVGTPAVSQPAPAAEPAGLPREIVARPPPPARRALWGAALELWRAHPVFGIGPDVFRHVYGPTIGLRKWDERIHTNNLYLELLVGSGIVGFSAFLVLLAGVSIAGARALLRTTGRARWAVLGCLVGLGSFLIHGTLDMFLEYSSTYLLAWGLLGALGALIAMEKTP